MGLHRDEWEMNGELWGDQWGTMGMNGALWGSIGVNGELWGDVWGCIGMNGAP